MKGEPKVIEYLKAGLRHELTAVNQYWLHYRLLEHWGYKACEILAQGFDRGDGARRLPRGQDKELGLGDPKWTDDELIDFMLAHPILINGPIVVTRKGVRLCRPSEIVLEILPNPDIGLFTKEDGEVVKAKG